MTPADRPHKSLWRRITTTIGVCAVVAISLLVFPNAILWMIFGWLVCFTWIRKTSRFAWLPLAVCLASLIVKGPYWSPALIALAVGVVLISIQSEWLGRTAKPANDVRGLLGAGTLWLLWCFAFWESWQIVSPAPAKKFDPHRPVVCLGDSLTTGLAANEAYPKYLQDLVTPPVINLGMEGITTRDGIKQLPAVLESNPQVVVIELGGHDFLRNYGRDATYDTLKQIIVACQKAGADVVLFEIPRGFIRDPFAGLERKLARELGVRLIPDTAIRQLVLKSSIFPPSRWLASEPLSSDGLHPNAAGALHLAHAVRNSLEEMYGTEILKPDR